MKRTKKALLIIGDKRTKGRTLDPSFNAFVRKIEDSKERGLEAHVVNYKDVFNGCLPEISSPILNVLLFFPYKYWDKNIEVYNDDPKVYGDKTFGRKFSKYFEKVEKAIEKKYSDKKIEYVNPPNVSILDRDKEETKNFFRHHKIPTPKSFTVKTLKDVHKIIDRGMSLYIKPRFGAMGKGITYLSNDLMFTNFLFKKGEIVSHSYDYHWRFHEIKDSDKDNFLKILLSRGFIFEEAIDPPIHKGRRSDFRVYCIYGEVVYYYVRSTPAITVVTNWSQGGKIEKKKKFSKYISASRLSRVKSLARKAARELKLNYAGIDIIFSKDYKNIYALEAHSFPGYEMGFDLMGHLAKKITSPSH
ncbi:MAG: hypothetical protein KAR31_13275 [Candidatus Omnitrophica bacterium]|nr:hypothetical protein [Candidatus Omnitrophota bacterium]MCK5259460.1 hypothetical protein [Candidatus Omnitrophota bacterium]